ncbi:MAG: hypothetical protein IT168_09815 [Bryobacterales bacterium]|nr:hypothetical protein [Bryobacterales bacterium]
MWFVRFAVILLLPAPGLAFSAKEWKKVVSDNFELFTTEGDSDAKRAIEYFERVRGFFVQALNMTPVSVNRVRLLAFSSEKEYLPYKPVETAFAYYLPTPDRDYIVMQTIDDKLFEVAAHEYVHLLVKHSGIKLPVWLNEGLADLYSNMRPVGNKIEVGNVLTTGRSYTLSQMKWLPLSTILNVQHDSPEYNERNRASIFYAQSWAMVHMLKIGQEYGPRSPEFFQLIFNGKGAQEAFQTVYGKNLGQVEKDLQAYTRQDRPYVAMYDARLIKKVENVRLGPADPADAQLALAHVLNHTRKREEAAKLITKLRTEYPSNVEVHEAFGYNKLVNDDAAAREAFGRATELGSKNARMYRDYAYLLYNAGPAERPKAVEALRKALALEPGYMDARYNLASMLVSLERYGEAHSELAVVTKVTPERAYWFFRTMAFCQVKLKAFDEAKKTALRAQSLAKDLKESNDIAQLIKYIDYATNTPQQQVQSATVRAPVAAAGPDGPIDTPTLRRKVDERTIASVDERRAVKNDLPEKMGTFELLDCRKDRAVVYLRDSKGEKSIFVIEDPTLVRVEQKGTNTTVELNCGPQKALVIVGYSPKADSTTGSIGVVRSITFE